MRIITVTGKGSLKIKPDMMRITLSLEGTSPEYSGALTRSAQETEQLKDVLGRFGFERPDLKTISFSVDTEYESYMDGSEYRQRFVGYRFRHAMKVEFASDNERLGKVLYALANCCVKPEFRISYTVRDREAAKNELLGKAVTDAREKASVLSAAAGVSLGEIQSVNYSWGEIEFEARPMNRMITADCYGAPMAAKQSLELDIEPEDIEVSDTVTVVWEIA